MPYDLVKVKVGQVWEDCDRRFAKRRVKVVTLTRTHAVVVRIAPTRSDTRTKIRLDRFRPTSTGYRLVPDTAEMIPASTPWRGLGA